MTVQCAEGRTYRRDIAHTKTYVRRQTDDQIHEDQSGIETETENQELILTHSDTGKTNHEEETMQTKTV